MALALITEASRGFGLALAKKLAAQGWELIIDGREGPALAEAAAGIGRNVEAVAGDVSNPAHRRQLAYAVRRTGRLDLLVNNASTLGPTPLPGLADYDLAQLEAVFRINASAPLALIQELLPYLQPSGTVVNITSDAAVEPYEGWGGYGASKAALDRISSGLGAEQPGLRVYAFDPGDMRTAMQQEAFPGEDISDRPGPETVVPSLLRLLEEAPPSGRYRAVDLAAGSLRATA